MPSTHPTMYGVVQGSCGPAAQARGRGRQSSCSRDDVTNKVFAITDRAETSNANIYAVLALLLLA